MPDDIVRWSQSEQLRLKHRWLDFASARAVGDLSVSLECLMQEIHLEDLVKSSIICRHLWRQVAIRSATTRRHPTFFGNVWHHDHGCVHGRPAASCQSTACCFTGTFESGSMFSVLSTLSFFPSMVIARPWAAFSETICLVGGACGQARGRPISAQQLHPCFPLPLLQLACLRQTQRSKMDGLPGTGRALAVSPTAKRGVLTEPCFLIRRAC